MRPPLGSYRVVRRQDGVHAFVCMGEGREIEIPHLMKHSPTGFEFGYGGSGPADLARSIVGHFLETDDPSPVLYHDFKWKFLARPELGPEFLIPAAAIAQWYDEASPAVDGAEAAG